MALKSIFKKYGFIMKNKRDLELAISLFLGCQKFRNFFSDPSTGYFWSFNSKKFLSYSENYNW